MSHNHSQHQATMIVALSAIIILLYPFSLQMSFRYAHFRELQSFHHAPAQFHALTQVQVPHRQARGFLTYLPGRMVQKSALEMSHQFHSQYPKLSGQLHSSLSRRYCNGSIYPIIFNCIFNKIINHPINQNITSCQYQFILWLFVTVHTTCDQQRLFFHLFFHPTNSVSSVSVQYSFPAPAVPNLPALPLSDLCISILFITCYRL